MATRSPSSARACCGHGHVVEQAEAHGPVGESVVTGRPDGDQPDSALGPQALDGHEPRPGGLSGRLPRAGGGVGVGIEGAAARCAELTQRLEIGRIVDPGELLVGRRSRPSRRRSSPRWRSSIPAATASTRSGRSGWRSARCDDAVARDLPPSASADLSRVLVVRITGIPASAGVRRPSTAGPMAMVALCARRSNPAENPGARHPRA